MNNEKTQQKFQNYTQSKMSKQQEDELKKAIQEGKVKELIEYWNQDRNHKYSVPLIKYGENSNEQIDQTDLDLKQIIEQQAKIIIENESKHEKQVKDLANSLQNHQQDILLMQKNFNEGTSIEQAEQISKQVKEIQQLKEALQLNLQRESEVNQLKESLQQLNKQENDLNALKKLLEEKARQQDEIKQLKQNLEFKEQQIKALHDNQLNQITKLEELAKQQEANRLSQISDMNKESERKLSQTSINLNDSQLQSSRIESNCTRSRSFSTSSVIGTSLINIVPSQVLVTRQLSPIKTVQTVATISSVRYVSPIRSVSSVSSPSKVVITQQPVNLIRQKLF